MFVDFSKSFAVVKSRKCRCWYEGLLSPAWIYGQVKISQGKYSFNGLQLVFRSANPNKSEKCICKKVDEFCIGLV